MRWSPKPDDGGSSPSACIESVAKLVKAPLCKSGIVGSSPIRFFFMWALAEAKLIEKQNEQLKKLDGFSYSAAVKRVWFFRHFNA